MMKTVLTNSLQRLRAGWLAPVIIVPLMIVTVSGMWFSVAAAAPPQSGEVAPDFELANVDSGTTKLSTIAEEGPVVLIVLRGFPGYQCPLCNVQINDFLKSQEKFQEAGAQVVFVYPGAGSGLIQKAKQFRGDRVIPEHYTLLVDPDYQFTNQYGLRWKAPNETAYPATFVLDRDRKVLYSKVSDSHGGRTTAKNILEQLAKSEKQSSK